MTPTTCTCHPGTTCTSAASCATARELHFGAQPAAQRLPHDETHDWSDRIAKLQRPAAQEAASEARELAHNMMLWREDARMHGSEYVPVHVRTLDNLIAQLRGLPAPQQATPAQPSHTLICGKCKVDRLRAPCPNLSNCGMGFVAQGGNLLMKRAEREALSPSALQLLVQAAQQATPEPERITVQEAWEAAGGNPGIKASKADLLEALRQLDKVCDEAPAEPSRGMISMGAQALASELSAAVVQDNIFPEDHDMAAGKFGPNVSAWLRKVATEYLSKAATPEPVGEVFYACPDELEMLRQRTVKHCLLSTFKAHGEKDVTLYTRPAAAPAGMALVPMTQQQLREEFHKRTKCTLGGDIALAEKVAAVVEAHHAAAFAAAPAVPEGFDVQALTATGGGHKFPLIVVREKSSQLGEDVFQDEHPVIYGLLSAWLAAAQAKEADHG